MKPTPNTTVKIEVPSFQFTTGDKAMIISTGEIVTITETIRHSQSDLAGFGITSSTPKVAPKAGIYTKEYPDNPFQLQELRPAGRTRERHDEHVKAGRIPSIIRHVKRA